MNFTLDDSSTQLSYTPLGWSPQTSTDPEASQFFQGTYHAAEVDGASVNMSIAGTAVYLYGSKGPGHGDFSVQVDGAVHILSAFADTTAYQQLLFSHVFSSSSTSPHFVSLTARLSGNGVHGSWFDFDFVTITSPSSSNATEPLSALPAAVPPWLSTSSTSSTSSTAATSAASAGTSPLASSPTQKGSSRVPTILAAFFGAILGLILLGALLVYLLRRVYDTRRARERDFRYGNSSVAPRPGPAISSWSKSPGSSAALLNLATPSTLPPDVGGEGVALPVGKANNTHALTPPSSPGYGAVHGEKADSTTTGTLSSASAVACVISGPAQPTPAAAPSTSTPFAFLASAPISFGLGSRRHKGDADSLRTDFLQV